MLSSEYYLDVHASDQLLLPFHDPKRLASGGTDGVINLWDLETYRKITSLKGHRNTVYSLAFSHDGNLLVSGSFDRRVNIWALK
jgi:WD40 repeat protein